RGAPVIPTLSRKTLGRRGFGFGPGANGYAEFAMYSFLLSLLVTPKAAELGPSIPSARVSKVFAILPLGEMSRTVFEKLVVAYILPCTSKAKSSRAAEACTRVVPAVPSRLIEMATTCPRFETET